MKYYIDNVEVTIEQYKVAKQSGLFNETISKQEKRLQYTNETKISQLKAQLQATDYKAIKYSEGLISEDDYAPIKAQRQAWRDEINELENKQ